MIEQDIPVTNKLGLHARAATKLAKTASRFQSRVDIVKGEQVVDGKSVMSLMLLAASQGSTLRLRIDGSDQEAALRALRELIEDRFGEGE